MVLTDRDRTELHDAMIEYLRAQRLPHLADQLQAELHQPPAAPSLSTNGASSKASSRRFTDSDSVLERRWNMLRRLSIHNLDLESQNKKLKEEIKQLKDPRTIISGDWLPSANSPCVATLHGHRGPLTALCVHPADPLCFSSSEDGTVRMWDLATRRSISSAKEHGGYAVSCLAIQPLSGALLASGGADCGIILYNTTSLERTQTLRGHDGAITALCFVRGDDQSLASGSQDGDVRVWDITRGVPRVQLMNEHPMIHAIAACGEMLAFSSKDNSVVLYNWESQQIKSKVEGLHSNSIDALCFSTEAVDAVLDPRSAAATTSMMHLPLAATSSSTRLAATYTAASPSALSSSPSSSLYVPRYIVSGGRDKLIFVVEIQTLIPVISIADHNNWVRQVQFSMGGSHLISCSDDGAVYLFNLGSKSVVRKLSAHSEGGVRCIAQQICGRFPLFVTGSADCTLKLWPCST